MRVMEIKKIPKKDIVIPDSIMRSFQDVKDEDIESLSTSIKNNGMINEIDVRIKNDKFELICGARRFIAEKEDEILAKIYENVSDLKAMIIGLEENLQIKNLDINVRDAYIYKIWKKGKESGDFKYMKDLAKEISISPAVLSAIISAGEVKEKTASPVIQKATSWDLERTKPLSDHPDIREKLLKKQQDNQLTSEGVEKISRNIKVEMNTGTEKEVVVKALEVASNTVKKYLKSNTAATSHETSPRVSIGGWRAGLPCKCSI